MEPRPKKLLEQVQETIRRRHYSPRTAESYTHWIRRFILFHGKRHPREMNVAEIEAFLNHLAVEEHVAASTQNQALSALLFLYRDVMAIDLERPCQGRSTAGKCAVPQNGPRYAPIGSGAGVAAPHASPSVLSIAAAR